MRSLRWHSSRVHAKSAGNEQGVDVTNNNAESVNTGNNTEVDVRAWITSAFITAVLVGIGLGVSLLFFDTPRTILVLLACGSSLE